MLRVLTIVLCFSTALLFAADDKKNAKDTNKEEKLVIKREYSEEEFQKEVIKEVLTRIDKIKKSSVSVLVKEIAAKESRLKVSEYNLLKKQELFKNNTKELENKIKDFKKKQNKILGCIDENKKNGRKRIDQMVDIISNMKPVKAAEILSVQDSSIAVQILSGMKPEKVSKVFNLMDKEISARLQKQYLNMQK